LINKGYCSQGMDKKTGLHKKQGWATEVFKWDQSFIDKDIRNGFSSESGRNGRLWFSKDFDFKERLSTGFSKVWIECTMLVL